MKEKKRLLVAEDNDLFDSSPMRNHRHRHQKMNGGGLSKIICQWSLFFFFFVTILVYFYSGIDDISFMDGDNDDDMSYHIDAEENDGLEVELKIPLVMGKDIIKNDKHLQCIIPKNNNIHDERSNDGYLVINANGGLNQMRMGICDMVAIAKMMNATLVVPSMDGTSYWNDQSEFKDIFNVDHFIHSLQGEVQVVESLPPEYANTERLKLPPISYSKIDYYEKKMKGLLKKYKVIEFTHVDSRLANNGIPLFYQKLRCFTNYKALQFTDEIYDAGEKIVERLMEHSEGQGYIALHLRYEKDMLSFTGCSHNLIDWEAKELETMRYGVKRWKEKKIDGEKKRQEGKCPMCPHEAALFLEAMGFHPKTHIYIVAGELYGTNSIKNIESKFPNLHTHHSLLAGTDQLKKLTNYQNRLAAVDYYVAVKSNVFMYTYDGSMAKVVQGYRRFHGFLPTINPDKQMMVHLIDKLDNEELSWDEFASEVKSSHPLERLGAAYKRESSNVPKFEENFHANPFPDCFCDSSSTQTL